MMDKNNTIKNRSKGGTASQSGPERSDPIIDSLILSHGTLECHDVEASRLFYEEFLGLETVFHGKRTMLIRKGGYWGIVCVNRGDKVRPMGPLNHWGIDVASRELVDKARENALKYKEKYGIQKVNQALEQHGVYSFYLQDLDGNWWEIQSLPEPELYDRWFREGDGSAVEANN